MKDFLKKWLSLLFVPAIFGFVGAFLSPIIGAWGLLGVVLGILVNLFIICSYPTCKMTIWLEKGGYDGKFWEAHASFLWYSDVTIVDWQSEHSTSFDKKPIIEHIQSLVKPDERVRKKGKEIIYSPKAAQRHSIAENIEHVKQVAAQNGVKLPIAIEKIEEIRRKKYDNEPLAEEAVEKPVVLKVEGHCVTYKKGGKTMTRSKQGFTKAFGEPVLSKLVPEPTKKVTKKAGRKAKE